ncbi:MAG: LemA family protein [Bacilli bacterium]|jgi:LemA protein
MIWFFIGLFIIIGLILSYVISVYNKLIVLRNRVKDQWAQVDVQLKRRADLIPNLVETVKGYAKHETATFEAVIKARNKVTTATNPDTEMDANNMLSNALGKLFALAEAYPELKANTNFIKLQADLKEVEDKIAFARQFYNDSVLTYNNKTDMFPSNIVASIFKFTGAKFFETAPEDTQVPTVKF